MTEFSSRSCQGDVAQALVPAAPRLISALLAAGSTEERVDMSVDAAGISACAALRMELRA